MAAIDRLSREEQMMAQIVLGMAIDLFKLDEKETFTREEVLAMLDSVRTDPVFFDADVVIEHQSLDKLATEMVLGTLAAGGDSDGDTGRSQSGVRWPATLPGALHTIVFWACLPFVIAVAWLLGLWDRMSGWSTEEDTTWEPRGEE
jgi:hypothetical protein